MRFKKAEPGGKSVLHVRQHQIGVNQAGNVPSDQNVLSRNSQYSSTFFDLGRPAENMFFLLREDATSNCARRERSVAGAIPIKMAQGPTLRMREMLTPGVCRAVMV